LVEEGQGIVNGLDGEPTFDKGGQKGDSAERANACHGDASTLRLGVQRTLIGTMAPQPEQHRRLLEENCIEALPVRILARCIDGSGRSSYNLCQRRSRSKPSRRQGETRHIAGLVEREV
jgi:hypothetical protein